MTTKLEKPVRLMKRVYMTDYSYNAKSHETYIRIQTDIGDFEGRSKLSPDVDIKVASRLMGGEIAEHRAMIKYFKRKLKSINIALDTLEKLLKTLKADNHYIPNKEYTTLIGEIKNIEYHKENIEKQIKYRENYVNQAPKNRELLMTK